MSARPRTVYEEFLAVPPHLVAEIIHGTLRTQPRPATPHARASSRLGAKLDPFDRSSGGPGGWIILDEPELHLGADVVVPDIAGWRRERMPEMPDAPFFELSPDWVCEVLSKGTEATDRAEKMPIYAEWGVGYAWLLSPLSQTLEAYALESGAWRLVGTWRDGARPRVAPFDAIELELAALWAR